MDPKVAIDRFTREFVADADSLGPASDWDGEATRALVGDEVPSYTYFLRTVARQSYAGGLLRFILPESRPSLAEWNASDGWKKDWPLWSARLCVIAYDWLGRQVGFDLNRRNAGEFAISILEPGTGELLEVPTGFSGFIGSEVIDHREAALAAGFYAEWCRAGGGAPRNEECVGYKRPLFLGGQDSLENLELTDMAVYVSLCGQLFEQVRRLPPGAKIDKVTLR